jgi:hypothetical protein
VAAISPYGIFSIWIVPGIKQFVHRRSGSRPTLLHMDISRHGLPSNIVSDRDVRLTSKFWRALHMHMGTTLSMSSAHHPQSNGKTERMNHTINSILRHFISEEQTDWATMLPMAQYVINSSVSETTGYAPWELNRGYIPQSLGSRLATISENELAEVTRFAEHAREELLLAQDALISARIRRVHYVNQQRSSVAESHFSEGDLVWLSTRNMSIVPGRTHKWTPKYVGPFEILRSWPATDTFELDLPRRYTVRNISKVLHVSKIKPYYASDALLFPNHLTTRVPTFPIDSVKMPIQCICHDPRFIKLVLSSLFRKFAKLCDLLRLSDFIPKITFPS